tara:strand:- start:5911 stop:6240 length:330 start_codon:yes stop_codon:yes gene_type:complete
MTTSAKPAALSLDNIKPALEELLELRADKADIEKRIKELDVLVRPVIEGEGKMQLGNFTFECKLQAGRKTLDKALLSVYLEAGSKTLSDFEKVGAPFTTMSVTEAAKVL